jgi:hypothetical protein
MSERVIINAERDDDGRGPVFARCPECETKVYGRDGTGVALVTSVAVHLNDLHAWSMHRTLFELTMRDPDAVLS